MLVRHAGRRRDQGMNDRPLAILADMSFGAETPLLSLPGLMHLRNARLAGVLR